MANCSLKQEKKGQSNSLAIAFAKYREKRELEKAKEKEEKERRKERKENEEERLDRMDSQKESSMKKHHHTYVYKEFHPLPQYKYKSRLQEPFPPSSISKDDYDSNHWSNEDYYKQDACYSKHYDSDFYHSSPSQQMSRKHGSKGFNSSHGKGRSNSTKDSFQQLVELELLLPIRKHKENISTKASHAILDKGLEEDKPKKVKSLEECVSSKEVVQNSHHLKENPLLLEQPLCLLPYNKPLILEKYSSSNDCKSEEKFQICSKKIILPLSIFDSNSISTNHEIKIQKSFDFMDFPFHDLEKSSNMFMSFDAKCVTFVKKINISSIIHSILRYYRRMDMCFLMNSYRKFHSSNYNTLSCIHSYFLHMHYIYSVSLGYHIGSFSCHFIMLRYKVGFYYVNYHVVFLGFRKTFRLESYSSFPSYHRLSTMHFPLHQSLGIDIFLHFREEIIFFHIQYPLIFINVASLGFESIRRLPFTPPKSNLHMLILLSLSLTSLLVIGSHASLDLRTNPFQEGGDGGKPITIIQEKDVKKEAKGEG